MGYPWSVGLTTVGLVANWTGCHSQKHGVLRFGLGRKRFFILLEGDESSIFRA
jgi:hypothetical protein